jgi:hypothetical protein
VIFLKTKAYEKIILKKIILIFCSLNKPMGLFPSNDGIWSYKLNKMILRSPLMSGKKNPLMSVSRS